MPHVVRAFGRCEEAEGGRDQVAHLVEVAWPSSTEERFEFGEGLFDGIEGMSRSLLKFSGGSVDGYATCRLSSLVTSPS